MSDTLAQTIARYQQELLQFSKRSPDGGQSKKTQIQQPVMSQQAEAAAETVQREAVRREETRILEQQLEKQEAIQDAELLEAQRVIQQLQEQIAQQAPNSQTAQEPIGPPPAKKTETLMPEVPSKPTQKQEAQQPNPPKKTQQQQPTPSKPTQKQEAQQPAPSKPTEKQQVQMTAPPTVEISQEPFPPGIFEDMQQISEDYRGSLGENLTLTDIQELNEIIRQTQRERAAQQPETSWIPNGARRTAVQQLVDETNETLQEVEETLEETGAVSPGQEIKGEDPSKELKPHRAQMVGLNEYQNVEVLEETPEGIQPSDLFYQKSSSGVLGISTEGLERIQDVNATRESAADLSSMIDQDVGQGKLKVQVYASGGVYPIANARVVIYKKVDGKNYVLYDRLTDVNGIVDQLILPAPDRSLSQNPEEAMRTQPYSDFSIYVEHPDFLRVNYPIVTIFEGVESLKPIVLIPKSKGMTEDPAINFYGEA